MVEYKIIPHITDITEKLETQNAVPYFYTSIPYMKNTLESSKIRLWCTMASHMMQYCATLIINTSTTRQTCGRQHLQQRHFIMWQWNLKQVKWCKIINHITLIMLKRVSHAKCYIQIYATFVLRWHHGNLLRNKEKVPFNWIQIRQCLIARANQVNNATEGQNTIVVVKLNGPRQANVMTTLLHKQRQRFAESTQHQETVNFEVSKRKTSCIITARKLRHLHRHY